jgi:hypothetical protein
MNNLLSSPTGNAGVNLFTHSLKQKQMEIYALCKNLINGEGYDEEYIVSYHLNKPVVPEDNTIDSYGDIIPLYFIKTIKVLP